MSMDIKKDKETEKSEEKISDKLLKWAKAEYLPMKEEIKRLNTENERLKEENQILTNMTINYNKQESPSKVLKLREKIKELQEDNQALAIDRARYRDMAQGYKEKINRLRGNG